MPSDLALPTLSREILLESLDHHQVIIDLPSEEQLTYPEKVLQFGTGALLRGLIDFVIHQANKEGLFKGRVVLVQSTGSSRANTINTQDGLFTQRTEGFQSKEEVKELLVNAAISRAISAKDHWDEVLECATNPDMNIIISNTTEIGLAYREEDIFANPPASFPAKLTSWLFKRFDHFNGSAEKGMMILPCELILDNGDKLREVILAHIAHHQLGGAFQEWITHHCHFCNTLVDRIVTGRPDDEKLAQLWNEMGFKDEMLTVNEVYRLWAIEGKASLAEKISFIKADPGVVLSEDISPYRERKLRILNGSHTISVALAFLMEIETIYDAMNHPLMSEFIRRVVHEEIVPTLPVDRDSAVNFANEVLDRFRNPFLHHKVLSITLQYTTKMNARNVPTFVRYVEQQGSFPPLMTLGLAAYLHFLAPVKEEEGRFTGEWQGKAYPINDDKANYFYQLKHYGNEEASIRIQTILSNEAFWQPNFATIPGLIEAVTTHIKDFNEKGVSETLKIALAK